MTQTVFVTNRSNTELRDGFGGVFYDFVKDQTVEVPSMWRSMCLVTENPTRNLFCPAWDGLSPTQI